MTARIKAPVVAIVGRPNVGKSSLLNRLAEERISIVEPTPGVTRDRVSTFVAHGDVVMEVVDTGGIGIIDRGDLAEPIDRQIDLAIDGADLILFVVDAREGLLPLDREVAARLREHPALAARPRPILLVANKVDGPQQEAGALEFYSLGFGDPIAVSALEGFGRTELLDAVVERLPPTGDIDVAPVLSIAVVGRQNVGKSTFVNALAREERVIVSEIPGTTRDAVDVRFEKDGRTFVVIDTAGLQRRTRVKDAIEFYSQTRTDAAVRRADVVLLLIDASAEISRVDKKIADTIADLAKACVIVINKWDLSKGQVLTERYVKYLHSRLTGLTFAPVVFTTAKDGRNVQSAVDLAQHLFKKASHRVGTGELNRLVERVKTRHGPARAAGRLPKIFFATQVGVCPPTFVFFVNDPKLFRKDYQRYVENSLRDELGFQEIPLRVFFRQRQSIYSERAKKS
jgi:GTP-binding protein